MAPVPDNRVAPLIEEIVPSPDPVRCCELLDGLPYRLFLDSAARGARLGRYSFLMADPVAVVRSKGAHVECLDLPGGTARVVAADALDVLRALVAPHATGPVPGLPPFQGGAAGYLAYDWGRVLERLPVPRYDDLALPDVVFGVYDWVLAWDHDTSSTWLISTGLPETAPAGRARRASTTSSLPLSVSSRRVWTLWTCCARLFPAAPSRVPPKCVRWRSSRSSSPRRGCLLRRHWVLERHRAAGQQHRHPHGGRARRSGILQRRWWHCGRLGPRAGVPRDA